MANIVTFDELKRIGRDLDRQAILKGATRTRTGKTVFLSHSSKDAELLPVVIRILEGHGAHVYVDLNDNRLPKTPSTETGRILRDTIRACRKLIVFVTTNSRDSSWVPWELGFGDGQKTDRHVCLFPSAEHLWEVAWIGQEYFGIYERIVWGKLQGYDNELWMVLNHHENTAVPLADWLAR